MKRVELHRLNDQGMARMGEFLDSLTGDSPQQCPRSILTDGRTSESLPVKVLVEEDRVFPRRYEAAEYLYNLLSSSALREPERDRGLWAWLALLWFDQLCPPDKTGQRKPGERARWIPEIANPRRYYRHFLLGPYLVYRVHARCPDLVEPILLSPLDTAQSEAYQWTVESPSLLASEAVMGAIKRLYFDEKTRRLRRGSQSKGPGSIRRLTAVLNQLERTFDLHSLSVERLLQLLPREFRAPA